VVLTAGLESPEDVAIDYFTGNIYFSDSGYSHIAVCLNDGYDCVALITSNIHQPRGLALYPSEGLMYWTDWGDSAYIGISSMDGNNARELVNTNIVWPNGLALDWPNNRLYWTDAKTVTIESVRTDGSDRRVVLHDILKHPYGIAIFGNRLFWSDWDTESIQSCDKFSGKNREMVVANETVYGKINARISDFF
jgi:sugar lactone lactonase YvrE